MYRIERVLIKNKNTEYPCKWSKNVYLNRKSIRNFKNCDNSLLIPTKMCNFVLITSWSYYVICLFFIGHSSLVGEPPLAVRNLACFQITSNFFVLITRFEVLLTIHPWSENHHCECEIRLVFRFLLQTITVTNVYVNSDFC